MSFRDVSPREKGKLVLWPLQVKEVNYELITCRGIPQNNSHDEGVLNELIETFKTRDSDVFICTYVKSGTTWTQQIINVLLNKGEKTSRSYAEAVPWLEAAAFGGFLGGIEATGWTMESIAANPEQRFFKTHANLKDLPCGKAPGAKTTALLREAKGRLADTAPSRSLIYLVLYATMEHSQDVIYVCRNPKDVCVSLHHHAKNKPMFGYDGEFSNILRFFAEGTCENGSWFDHVLEWYEASKADPEHVLFLRYEDMMADPISNVKKIADFSGIETTPEIIEKTVENSSLSAMKKVAAPVKSEAAASHFKEHLRKGGAGGWRDVFTVRQSSELDRVYLEQMAGSGLEMDFGEGLSM